MMNGDSLIADGMMRCTKGVSIWIIGNDPRSDNGGRQGSGMNRMTNTNSRSERMDRLTGTNPRSTNGEEDAPVGRMDWSKYINADMNC